ncbi:DUF3363 domain-containing protein [Citricoccus parietis]|uniref:DUF3363 domain-containing protein n=1 Tax=Citricoccus parietis TaxID=592307 RepID=A0ABV5GA01_9MICC
MISPARKHSRSASSATGGDAVGAVAVAGRRPGSEGGPHLARSRADGRRSGAVRDVGYGREVRTALTARRQWLIEQQLADGERSGIRYRDGALETLRQRELREAASGSATDLGKRFELVQMGERIEGKIKCRVDLESGSHALVERSRDFTLVPWRDVLDRNIGKAASGIMRADGINWQFGRGRNGPVIS